MWLCDCSTWVWREYSSSNHPKCHQHISLPLGPFSLAGVVWCPLKAIQIGDCFLRYGSGLHSFCLYMMASLTDYFLSSLSSLKLWFERRESGWQDRFGLIKVSLGGFYLPASDWRLLPAPAQCGGALGLWTAFAPIRDCSTWKRDSMCQLWLSLGCCNLHLMVLLGSACQLHLELKESLKPLGIRLLVNHRLSRPVFLCGSLMEAELK